MMTSVSQLPLLSLLVFLPAVAALLLALLKPDDKTSKQFGLGASLVVFALSLKLLFGFDPNGDGFQFVEKFTWFRGLSFGPLNLTYHLGVDGISLFFVLLSTLLTSICMAASYNSVHRRVREYIIAFLILETMMIGSFVALDMFLFYTFFEGVLIPMYIIIGVWGGARRIYSAFKFFLYTLLGSVLMLVAMIYMAITAGTTDMPTLMQTAAFTPEVQMWLWIAFFASFAVKMPMWPVHTWLPDAHVEAPTGGSVILAGVLLKMGGYGFMRFSMPMLPEASHQFAQMIYWLSVIAIVYTSLIALVQKDMKKMIAYSSVAHMGYVTLGLFTFTREGIDGALFQMISHGLVSGALFLSVGVLYDRLHTRDIDAYGGVVKLMPVFSVLFMLFMLGSVGLPGTSGFVGEFLSLLGAFKVDTLIGLLSASGMVLGAAYMLVLYRKVVFGLPKPENDGHLPEANAIERTNLVLLAVLVLLIGVLPGLVLERTGGAVNALLSRVNHVTPLTQQVSMVQ